MALRATKEPIIHISPASESDYGPCARILCMAMSVDLVTLCLFDTPPYDFSVQEVMAMGLISQEASNPNSYIYKAVNHDTQEIVAVAIVQIKDNEDGEKGEKEPEESGADQGSLPDGVNADFWNLYFGSLEEKYEKHMNGKRHAVLNQLMILPAYQRQGLGSKMIRYAVDELSLSRLPVWLHTQVRASGFYNKFGWQEVDRLNVDMSEWKGKGLGFGTHSSLCMVREPGVETRD